MVKTKLTPALVKKWGLAPQRAISYPAKADLADAKTDKFFVKMTGTNRRQQPTKMLDYQGYGIISKNFLAFATLDPNYADVEEDRTDSLGCEESTVLGEVFGLAPHGIEDPVLQIRVGLHKFPGRSALVDAVLLVLLRDSHHLDASRWSIIQHGIQQGPRVAAGVSPPRSLCVHSKISCCPNAHRAPPHATAFKFVAAVRPTLKYPSNKYTYSLRSI